MQYLDSSVLIAAYLSKDPHHEICRQFMRNLSSGHGDGVISIFGLAEVAGYFSRNINPDASQAIALLLRAMPHLTIIPHFVEIPSANLMELCIEYGLSGADALHVIHAQSFLGVDEIVTLDHDFTRVRHLMKVTILR